MYEKNPVPLAVHFVPIALTFGITNQGKTVLMDPTYNEESVLEGSVTIVLNRQRELVAVSKAGGAVVQASTILNCQQQALNCVEEMVKKIETIVQADLDKRKAFK